MNGAPPRWDWNARWVEEGDRLTGLDLEHEAVAVNLERALAIAGDWHRAYLEAGPTDRRHLNQAIFKKIFIDDPGTRPQRTR